MQAKRRPSLFTEDSDDDLNTALLQEHQEGRSTTETDDLSENDAESEVDPEKIPDVSKWTWLGRLKVTVISTIGAVAVVASGAAIAFSGSVIVYVACGLGLLVQPLAVANEVKLANGDTWRARVKLVKREMGRFRKNNRELSGNINQLEKDVRSAKDVEQRLYAATRRQNVTAYELLELVKQNRVIVQEMHNMVKSAALQTMISTIINSDKNHNCEIDEDELPLLLHRLRFIDYLNVNEDLLRAEIRKDNSLKHVIELARGMLSGDLGEENVIFSVATDADDAGDEGDNIRSRGGSFEAEARRRKSLPVARQAKSWLKKIQEKNK